MVGPVVEAEVRVPVWAPVEPAVVPGADEALEVACEARAEEPEA
jgi:hypothetical protein